MNSLTIPNYTKEDYLLTSNPYEFLYMFRDDKFQMAQLREKMKEHAASLGVKGFIGLWNAYLETLKSSKNISVDNATDFENQSLELMSGKYRCDEMGISYVDRYGYDVEVCKHPIMPVQRLVNIDNGEERLKIAFKKGFSWRYIIAEKSKISSASKILDLSAYGIMVNSENAKLLSTYLFDMEQMYYSVIPEQKSIDRLGWVDGHGFSPYVDGLVFDGEQSYKALFDLVRSHGSFDVWLNAAREVRAYTMYGKLFLAASFASVILKPLGLLPFFLHAWGGSGNGKTVGTMMAASVWADPPVNSYVATFDATTVGMELRAGFLNSLPLCLDELQIKAAIGVTDFDDIIYRLTEGSGRTRGKKEGGLRRTATWCNAIITSGEKPITSASSGGGAKNRVIEFECDEKIHPDLHALANILRENYGFAGKIFVDWLRSDENIIRIKEIQSAYYKELSQTDTTEKQTASLAAMLAADKIATEIIFKDDNALTISEAKKILLTKLEVDTNSRALEFLRDWITINSNRLTTNDFGNYPGEVWGFIDFDCVYIVKNIFDKVMRENGYDSTAFLNWAKRENKIRTEAGRTTKLKKLNGSSIGTRCICLKTSEEIVEDDDLF